MSQLKDIGLETYIRLVARYCPFFFPTVQFSWSLKDDI